jgi:hypothetical protein
MAGCVAVLAWSGPAPPEDRFRSPKVAVIVAPGEEEPPCVGEAMRREAERLLAPACVIIQWRTLSPDTHREVFERIVMVRLKGVCRVAPVTGPLPRPETLGLTHVSDGTILPFAEVDCDAVRAVIARRMERVRGQGAREALLGRALGRVLVHELYHILADTLEHSERGVARRVFGARELTCEGFEFDPPCLGNLRRDTVSALLRRQE